MKITALVCCLVLAGCASLGLAPAQTFDQKLAYAYGVHTAVLQTADVEVKSKVLAPADGQAVLKLADDSRTLLDAARAAAAAGDSTTGNNKLALATTVLTQIQQYLNSRSAK